MAGHSLNALEQVLALNINRFFEYIRSVRYSYQDQEGNLHFLNDPDFKMYEYSFSSLIKLLKITVSGAGI